MEKLSLTEGGNCRKHEIKDPSERMGPNRSGAKTQLSQAHPQKFGKQGHMMQLMVPAGPSKNSLPTTQRKH